MATVAAARPPPPPQAPELSDAEYFQEVLKLPGDRTEANLDDELLTRAQGLGISTSRAPNATADKRYTSSAQSASTAVTYHARTFSNASNGSASTALTANSSIFSPSSPDASNDEKRQAQQPKNLSFSQYDKYLDRIDKILDQPSYRKGSVATIDASNKSVFSVSTKRSVSSIKSGFKSKMRWRRKSFQPFMPSMSCICCRDEFNKTKSLHNLPCGHTYCSECLKVMISQSTSDESKMPPRCCTQPIPGNTIKEILPRESQQKFLKAVVQFSTPWESRIFCPNTSCGEFIPPRNKVDPKHPFDVTCRKCRARVCVICKQNAHPFGKECPEDFELEAVLKMGEKSGWRRCYKCRNLVELTQGCTHMTCRCKAQFCYICGGVWDPSFGCPNVCNGEEELERRRLEEEARLAELEAEKEAQVAAVEAEATELQHAKDRASNHESFQQLYTSQAKDLELFLSFWASAKERMSSRHSMQKVTTSERHDELEEKMKERHTKTVNHLEDRQVAAEMELRSTLEQSERSVNIRLKHMEAYCDGLGRQEESGMPSRTVTERDLRELGHQYNMRDGMERLHQSKINVMRDRQAKGMEELLDRQEEEYEKMVEKRQEDFEVLAATFALETDTLSSIFTARKQRLQRRWELAVQVLCKDVEKTEGIKFVAIATPVWPTETTTPAPEEQEKAEEAAEAAEAS